MVGTSECGNEPLGSIKCGEYLDCLKNHYLFTMDSAVLS